MMRWAGLSGRGGRMGNVKKEKLKTDDVLSSDRPPSWEESFNRAEPSANRRTNNENGAPGASEYLLRHRTEQEP